VRELQKLHCCSKICEHRRKNRLGFIVPAQWALKSSNYQHHGSVHLSTGGGPAEIKVTSNTSTAAAAPAPWNAPELQAFSRIDSSFLILSFVSLAAGSTGTARLLVRTLGRLPVLLLRSLTKLQAETDNKYVAFRDAAM
jgi:hypothetical protein